MSMFIIAVTNGALLSGSRHLPTIYPVVSVKCASLPGLRPSSTPPASIINLRHCIGWHVCDSFDSCTAVIGTAWYSVKTQNNCAYQFFVELVPGRF